MSKKKKLRREFRNRGRSARYQNMVQISSSPSVNKSLLTQEDLSSQLHITASAINHHILKVRSIIKKYDPIRLLLYSYGSTMWLIRGKLSEAEYGEEENMAFRLTEYIFNTIVSTPLIDSLLQRVDEDEWNTLFNEFTNLFRETFSYFLLESMISKSDDNDAIERDFIHFQEKMRWVGIRGDRYMLNDTKFLRRFLQPHDEIFRDIYGISIDELIKGFDKIQEALN